MKIFNPENSEEKLAKYIFNLITLAILYFIGYWLGRKYDPDYSPYIYAYMLPSLVAGLVFCKRFSDNAWIILHPHSVGRVKVYHYYEDYDPGFGIVGLLFKYAFYAFIGIFIFPIYSLWAFISIIWLGISIYRNKAYSI